MADTEQSNGGEALTGRHNPTGDGGSDPISIDNKEELDDLIERRSAVLVNFYTDWCGPCELLEPTLQKIAEKTDITVVEIDYDERGDIAHEYSIRSLPTILLYVDGTLEERKVGVSEEETLRDILEKYHG